MNELMEKLASIVSSRCGGEPPPDAEEGELWIKTEVYINEEDEERTRMALMLRRNGEDVNFVNELAGNYLLERVVNAASEKLADTLVLRNASGAAALDVTGNAESASKWAAKRTLTLKGDAAGSVQIDGSQDIELTVKAQGAGGVPTGAVTAYWGVAAPQGWFICNGGDFDTAANPKLYSLLASAKLPDLRGYFIRGWDARATDDPNRVDKHSIARLAGSIQGDAIRNITGTFAIFEPNTWQYGSGAFYNVNMKWLRGTKGGGGYGRYFSSVLDVSRVVPTADENRPVNIALNYIIKGG
jgi:hypothetical protein